jgi:hypothetical protein
MLIIRFVIVLDIFKKQTIKGIRFYKKTITNSQSIYIFDHERRQ